MVSSATFVALLAAAAVQVTAIGDFPCAGNSTDVQSCSAWSTDSSAQGVISATAECIADPLSDISYCGYAHATCSTDSDCDYGACGSSGTCTGYLGDSCSSDTDCEAFFFCGTDGTCGGTGAACANGDADSPIPTPDLQCVSQNCNTSKKTCAAPPTTGVANGFACTSDSMCASGKCSSGLLCVAQASAAASKHKKRFLHGPSVSNSCDFGETQCVVDDNTIECIDTLSNLERCGGCVTDNQGTDCTAIPGVESVLCQQGKCVVLQCMPGMAINTLENGCILL